MSPFPFENKEIKSICESLTGISHINNELLHSFTLSLQSLVHDKKQR